MDRIRVASLQYYVRPVTSFDQFADQVGALVETARDYKCQLLVFPEYFTVQLLTLGDIKRPIAEQVRDLANQVGAYVDLMRTLAKRYGLYIAAGTIPVIDAGQDEVHNDSFLFAPSGEHAVQGKIHMTRFESEEWKIAPRHRLRIFETSFGPISIQICYDVEFPELARVAARNGANIIVVPSCTDDRQGYLRVRYCAHARTIENQLFVVHSPLVGSLPNVPAVSLNYGQASILTPSDFTFARDGILAEGIPCHEMMVLGELDLESVAAARERGTVLPLRDSQRTADVAATVEVVRL